MEDDNSVKYKADTAVTVQDVEAQGKVVDAVWGELGEHSTNYRSLGW
jgi:hypothetical protein